MNFNADDPAATLPMRCLSNAVSGGAEWHDPLLSGSEPSFLQAYLCFIPTWELPCRGQLLCPPIPAVWQVTAKERWFH